MAMARVGSARAGTLPSARCYRSWIAFAASVFLSAANLQMAHERVTSRTVIDEREIERYDRGIREWCLCDGVHFYREDEQSAEYVLRDLADGRDLACDDLHSHRARYDEIVG